MRIAILLVAAMAVAGTGGALATTIEPQDFVCPVGGEKFQAGVIMSMSTWGQRPDGRRYGTTPVIELTECPGNGFVYFDDKFSDTEKAQLAPLTLSPEYQTMRKSEVRHYRAYWLAKKVGRDPYHLARLLLTASWDSERDAVRKARYQAEFATSVEPLIWSQDKGSDYFWLHVRAANALRELGRFDAATRKLIDIDKADLLPADAEGNAGARRLIDGLRVLIAERNRSSEPPSLTHGKRHYD